MLNQVRVVAEAMKMKRRELIAQPLDSIWEELAKVAIDEASRIRLIQMATMDDSEHNHRALKAVLDEAVKEINHQKEKDRWRMVRSLFRRGKGEAKNSAA